MTNATKVTVYTGVVVVTTAMVAALVAVAGVGYTIGVSCTLLALGIGLNHAMNASVSQVATRTLYVPPEWGDESQDDGGDDEKIFDTSSPIPTSGRIMGVSDWARIAQEAAARDRARTAAFRMAQEAAARDHARAAALRQALDDALDEFELIIRTTSTTQDGVRTDTAYFADPLSPKEKLMRRRDGAAAPSDLGNVWGPLDDQSDQPPPWVDE